jgi:hypothetical protein
LEYQRQALIRVKKKGKMSLCKFKSEWQDRNLNPKFASWIQPVENDATQAYCVLCQINIKVGSMGASALTRHIERRHKGDQNLQRRQPIKRPLQNQHQIGGNSAPQPPVPDYIQQLEEEYASADKNGRFEMQDTYEGEVNFENEEEEEDLSPVFNELPYFELEDYAERPCIPFRHTFTGICAGPTGCGKTELMKGIILNYKEMIHPAPVKIYWYYSESQRKLERALKPIGVKFREGMPELSEFDGNRRALLIVDDFMSECTSQITKLFTKGSHHRNLSIWFLMQNVFHKGKEIRSITLNGQYIILFNNPRDVQQVKVLARQMYGDDHKVLEEAFADATSKPHGYLLMDLKQDTPQHLRLRTNILPGEELVVYVSKKQYKKDYIEVTVTK